MTITAKCIGLSDREELGTRRRRDWSLGYLESLVEQGSDGKSRGADIVITSYGTLVSEFSKTQGDKPTSPVFESE